MNVVPLIDHLPGAENYDELLGQIGDRLYAGDEDNPDRELLGAFARATPRLPRSRQLDLIALAAEYCDVEANADASAHLCQAAEEILVHGDRPDDETAVLLLSAIATFKGCVTTASIINELAGGNVWCDCARCYRSLDVSEQLRSGSTGSVSGTPQPEHGWTEQNAGSRLVNLAERAGKQHVLQVLDVAMHALVECPHCRARFRLYEAMLRCRGVMA